MATFFCKSTILSEPLPENLSEIERHDILIKWNNVLSKLQNYIDINLHPRKQNYLGPREPDFVEIQSVDAILHPVDLNHEEYEYYLSIFSDRDMYLHLKLDPKSCFVNNYFSNSLLSWEANIDIQPAYNANKFSKSKDKWSTLMKEALKEAENSDKSKFETMVNAAKAYNTNRVCSMQEAAFLNMSQLWLRKCFPAIEIINTNFARKKIKNFQILLEIEELTEDSEDLVKRNMLIDTLIDQMLLFERKV